MSSAQGVVYYGFNSDLLVLFVPEEDPENDNMRTNPCSDRSVWQASGNNNVPFRRDRSISNRIGTW